VDRREDGHETSLTHAPGHGGGIQHYHVDKRGLRFPDRIRSFFKTRADRNLHRVEYDMTYSLSSSLHLVVC
jgi:hypothetical protein